MQLWSLGGADAQRSQNALLKPAAEISAKGPLAGMQCLIYQVMPSPCPRSAQQERHPFAMHALSLSISSCDSAQGYLMTATRGFC